jgi:hypothetical protein
MKKTEPLSVAVDAADNSESGIETGDKLGGGQVKIPKKQKLGGERFTMDVNLKATRENITQAPNSPRRQQKI